MPYSSFSEISTLTTGYCILLELQLLDIANVAFDNANKLEINILAFGMCTALH
jgi:hypothetical protein